MSSTQIQGDTMVDLLITGGDVIDGSGRARQRADVAITGDRITDIGNLEGATANQVIDATGKILSLIHI